MQTPKNHQVSQPGNNSLYLRKPLDGKLVFHPEQKDSDTERSIRNQWTCAERNNKTCRTYSCESSAAAALAARRGRCWSARAARARSRRPRAWGATRRTRAPAWPRRPLCRPWSPARPSLPPGAEPSRRFCREQLLPWTPEHTVILPYDTLHILVTELFLRGFVLPTKTPAKRGAVHCTPTTVPEAYHAKF